MERYQIPLISKNENNSSVKTKLNHRKSKNTLEYFYQVSEGNNGAIVKKVL